MNKEFKAKQFNDTTVYTLESATSGGTSSAMGASVSKPMGLIVQSRMGPTETPKPRNFVAKNAKMGGAGQHKDKKKAEKQGDVKHKKPFAEAGSPAQQAAIAIAKKKEKGMAEGEKTMSRAAKGNEKYGKDGMKALAKAGREGASEKKLDAIRDKHDHYNEGVAEESDKQFAQRMKKKAAQPPTKGMSQKEKEDKGWAKPKEQGVAEGSENNNTIAQKIFFARSNKTPKGWSYDHVGFITQDGKQIQMSGHKGNDVYVTNDVTDDPEFPKQNIKIVSLSKPVLVPTTNTVGAENCGTFVANVLQTNGIKGIDTQKIYSVFKKPHQQGVAEAKGKLTYTPEPTEYGVFPDSKNEFVKTFLSRDLALAHIKKFGGKLIVLDQHGRRMKEGVAEGSGMNVVKSVKVGNFRHDLVNTGMGWQVRIYNGDELYDTGLSKNSEEKGLAALDNSVAYTKKQLNIKEQGVAEEWSQKYKSSINCSHPKGFSQKAYCAGKKKHEESMMTMESVCPDCGMCQTHGNLNEIKKGAKDSNGFTKCWPGHHAAGTKKGKNGGQVRNCVPNEDHSDVGKGWGQGAQNTAYASSALAGAGHDDRVRENPEWYNDEANSMTTSQLKSLVKHAARLRQAVKAMSPDTLEPWQQSKITKAADYLDAVFNAVDDEYDMGESSHPDEKEDKALIRKMVKKQALKQEDGYMAELQAKLAEKIPKNAPVKAWIDDFAKAAKTPNAKGHHQFKNKSPEKVRQMAIAASYGAKNPSKKKK